MDEFQRIQRFFAPLSQGYAGALDLRDDAALIDLAAGERLVVTADAVVEGVHFLPEDSPDLVARKALRVNLSDLAAKGAVPFAYVQTVALRAEAGEDWLARYAGGLAEDQQRYGVRLIGGDSVLAPGPIGISITAFGRVGRAGMIRRAGARPGDRVYVTGSLGDSALGLMAIYGRIAGLDAVARAFLVDRYRLPQPRVSLGPRLIGLATAGLDISDGLVADLGHLCAASNVGAVVEVGRIPLSAAASAAFARDTRLLATVLTGGDDYELLFTAAPDAASSLADLAAEFDVPIGEIGYIVDGTGVTIRDPQGRPMTFERAGYRHF
jgi:thiamine-monophosphate kinase